ncbi:hypothetical protein B6U99_03220 [Candidatus Geothermarchaeota archaeon ex4572_27]|nr:MAG: hypothetical protein B6U99_03220 [Candidatus Geothermarchaeota archaeon ex4572_27]
MPGSIVEDAVLAAILKGADTLGKLRRVVNVEEAVLRRVLDNLVTRGYVKAERRGLLFKRDAYAVTAEGARAAEAAIRRLEAASREVRRRVERGEGLPSDYVAILPLLVWTGLLDIALLSLLDFALHGMHDYWLVVGDL